MDEPKSRSRRGRPAKAEDDLAVVVTVRLTPARKQKLRQLGAAWLSKVLDETPAPLATSCPPGLLRRLLVGSRVWVRKAKAEQTLMHVAHVESQTVAKLLRAGGLAKDVPADAVVARIKPLPSTASSSEAAEVVLTVAMLSQVLEDSEPSRYQLVQAPVLWLTFID